MARKRSREARVRHETGAEAGLEDTAMRSLSKEERARLSMDSWEPSLLRNLLRAENKLRER